MKSHEVDTLKVAEKALLLIADKNDDNDEDFIIPEEAEGDNEFQSNLLNAASLALKRARKGTCTQKDNIRLCKAKKILTIIAAVPPLAPVAAVALAGVHAGLAICNFTCNG